MVGLVIWMLPATSLRASPMPAVAKFADQLCRECRKELVRPETKGSAFDGPPAVRYIRVGDEASPRSTEFELPVVPVRSHLRVLAPLSPGDRLPIPRSQRQLLPVAVNAASLGIFFRGCPGRHLQIRFRDAAVPPTLRCEPKKAGPRFVSRVSGSAEHRPGQ